jgi:hypothetical protein
MGYVVKAVSASGAKMWVSPPRDNTSRIFVPRPEADIFRTQKEARTVIEILAKTFTRFGFVFEVDSAE